MTFDRFGYRSASVMLISDDAQSAKDSFCDAWTMKRAMALNVNKFERSSHLLSVRMQNGC